MRCTLIVGSLVLTLAAACASGGGDDPPDARQYPDAPGSFDAPVQPHPDASEIKIDAPVVVYDAPPPNIDGPEPKPDAPPPIDAPPPPPDAFVADASPIDARPPDASTRPDAVPGSICDLAGLMPDNDTCGALIDLTAAATTGTATVYGDTAGYVDDLEPPPACTSGYLQRGADALYRVDATEGDDIHVEVTPSGTSFDASVYILKACGDGNSCAAGMDAGTGGVKETLDYPVTTTGTYYIVVDTYSATATGCFTLAVQIRSVCTLGAAAADNDTCGQAIDITTAAKAGVSTAFGDDTGYANNLEPPAACTDGFGEDGPDAIYKVTASPGDAIQTTLTPDGWDGAVYIVSSCTDATTCKAGRDRALTNAPERLEYAVTASGTYYVVVDGFRAGEDGCYTLQTSVKPVCDLALAAPANDLCAEVIDLTAAATGGTATVYGDTVGYEDNVTASGTCAGTYTHDGPDAIYKVTAAAGKKIHAVLTPTNYDGSVYIIRNCADASTCVAGADAAGTNYGVETVDYTVTTAGTFFIVVDSYDASEYGCFTLQVDLK